MRRTAPASDARAGPREVDHASVTAVDLSDRPSQTIGRLRNRYQMDMIGHQAACQDLNLVSAAPFSHQFQVVLVIFVAKKRLLPAVSPLSDMMRKTRGDNSCHSGHDRRLPSPRSPVDN